MFTENYIKMCEKAKEIQCERILGRYNFGDLYYLESGHKNRGKFRFIGSYDGYDKDNELIEKSIWLPTQEQLFDMLLKWCQTDKILTYLLVGESINRYILKELYDHTHSFNGMLFVSDIKELTLSYIYKRKYNKIWNGKGWEEVK